MSEQAIAAAEPAAPTESGGLDFFSAIEAALNAPDPAPEPTPQPTPEPAKEQVAPEPVKSPDDVQSTEPDPEPSLPIDEPAPEPSASDESFEGLSGKAGRRFKQLKTELKQTTAELQTLRNELQAREQALAELKAASTDYDTLKQQLADYESTIAITKLEAHPAYIREVQEPMAQLVEAAEAIATRYEIDSDELIEILAIDDRDKQDEAFESLLVGVKERDKLAVYALAEQVPLIVARRNELAENARDALAELEQIESEQHQQELAKAFEIRKRAAEEVKSKLVQKIPFLGSIEDLKLDAISQRAGETNFDQLDTHNKVYAKIAGDLLPQLAREFVSLRAELEEAIDELESLRKVEPKAGAGPANSSAPTRTAGSFLDAINAALGS